MNLLPATGGGLNLSDTQQLGYRTAADTNTPDPSGSHTKRQIWTVYDKNGDGPRRRSASARRRWVSSPAA